MRKLLVLSVLALLGIFAAAQEHPWLEKQDSATRAMLEMYGATEEYLAMQDQMDAIIEQAEQTEKNERRTQAVILVISLAVALWPVVSGIRTFSKIENRTRGGMLVAIGILLLGAGVLFAFNYGALMFRHKEPHLFNLILAFGLVIAIVVLAVLMLRKDPKKNETQKSSNNDKK